MEPETQAVRNAPWPWSSESGGMDGFYKLSIVGSIIIGLFIFLLAYSGHLTGPPPWACMITGVLVMSMSGVFAYWLVMAQFKVVDDWLINYYPPKPESFYKVLASTEAYLQSKKYEYKRNLELKDYPITDPTTKKPMMEELLLEGQAGPQLRISNVIRDTKHLRFGHLEIRNVRKENLALATTIATDLAKAITDAGVEYDNPKKKKPPVTVIQGASS
jgi:hypothetical protein